MVVRVLFCTHTQYTNENLRIFEQKFFVFDYFLIMVKIILVVYITRIR